MCFNCVVLSKRQHQRTPKSIHAHRNNELLEFNSFFDGNVETKIVIHGWQSNTRSDTVQKIKDAYLRTRDCNVIGKEYIEIINSLSITKLIFEYLDFVSR